MPNMGGKGLEESKAKSPAAGNMDCPPASRRARHGNQDQKGRYKDNVNEFSEEESDAEGGADSD